MLNLKIIILQCWSGVEARKLSLLVRAVNFNVSLQQYSVVFITTLEDIHPISSALQVDGDVQTAVLGINPLKGAISRPIICTDVRVIMSSNSKVTLTDIPLK